MARRPPTRHGKRRQRFTPRRWLPFLAAVAVVAGLVVASQDDTTSAPTGLSGPPVADRMPAAAEPGSVSSAFYCAAGTAEGSTGAAELSALIANAGRTGTRAVVTVVGSNGRHRRFEVAVPANGTTRVSAREHVIAPWAAMTVETLGGRVTVEREAAGADGYDIAPCTSRAGTTWYVPYGATVRGASSRLALYNPFPDDASVDISFATPSGLRTPRDLQGFTVPARSVRMVDVNDAVARRDRLAATVVARSGRLIVDRSQIDDGTGDAVTGESGVRTDPPQGVVSVPAIPALADRWLVPNVSTAPGTRPEVVIANPGTRRARIEVAIRYQEPDRYPEQEPVTLTVRAGEQGVVDLTDLPDLVPKVGFTIEVTSLDGAPVAVEVALFRNAPSPSQGLTVVPGSPVAATRWFLTTEGTGKRRIAKVVVANPSARPITVRVDELVKGARRTLGGATVRIPGRDRRILDLDAGTPGVPLVVRATGPVVVQRSSTARTGVGLSFSLAMPFPETAAELPG